METVTRLQELLTLTKKSEIKCYSEYFKEIANLLMNKCVIAKGEKKYEIIEIEFYLFALDHQDIITYPRKLSAGQWFFHQSGVDLTFESSDNQFGGILIRGIKPLGTKNEGDYHPELILGPQKCVDELWDTFYAFKTEPTEYPIIKEDLSIPKDDCIESCKRWINVSEEKKAYKISDWSKRIIESKGTISVNEKDRHDIVFNSKYRFVKMKSIDQTSEDWKKYSSKPKFDKS
ncbi:MAG: hypothetical protein K2J82_00495 [Muribaculaceae bacterium]|nr:hypothetical protein [Muribaculaceae bacterium]